MAIATFAYAIFLAPKKVMQARDFYLDKCFDSKVREALEAKRTAPQLLTSGRFTRWGKPTPVLQLASETGFSERRVIGCLNRLKKKKQAVQQDDGEWKAPDEIT